MADPQKYRSEAKRRRLEAETASSPEISLQMLDVAAQYERLAASLEARTTDPARVAEQSDQ
jgi:hypothetical protein